MAFEMIETTQTGAVKVIQLDRPKALNALNSAMMAEVAQALAMAEADDSVGCVVLTGSEKAFAAGADIKEMVDNDYLDIYKSDNFSKHHGAIERSRKPIIAAVSGEAAAKIAGQSQPIAMMTKEAINAAFEMNLAQGVQFERRLFQSMFTTQDQTEGMNAFIEKRKPHFKNK